MSSAERMRAAVRAQQRRVENLAERLRQAPWPTMQPAPLADRVMIVVVNHNAIAVISRMLFSLYRVLDRREFTGVIVVDNDSRDGSRELLESLREAGLVTLLHNRGLPYHGPGLNRGVSFLARHQHEPRFRADLVCAMDSDVFAVRPGGLAAAREDLIYQDLALVGPPRAQMDPFYAHVSLNLFRPERVWQRGQLPFAEHDQPGIPMQMRMRATGLSIGAFPFYTERYFVHPGRLTALSMAQNSLGRGRYYRWAQSGVATHFEGVPGAFEDFAWLEECFSDEVGELNAGALVEACLRAPRLVAPAIN